MSIFLSEMKLETFLIDAVIPQISLTFLFENCLNDQHCLVLNTF